MSAILRTASLFLWQQEQILWVPTWLFPEAISMYWDKSMILSAIGKTVSLIFWPWQIRFYPCRLPLSDQMYLAFCNYKRAAGRENFIKTPTSILKCPLPTNRD